MPLLEPVQVTLPLAFETHKTDTQRRLGPSSIVVARLPPKTSCQAKESQRLSSSGERYNFSLPLRRTVIDTQYWYSFLFDSIACWAVCLKRIILRVALSNSGPQSFTEPKFGFIVW